MGPSLLTKGSLNLGVNLPFPCSTSKKGLLVRQNIRVRFKVGLELGLGSGSGVE